MLWSVSLQNIDSTYRVNRKPFLRCSYGKYSNLIKLSWPWLTLPTCPRIITGRTGTGEWEGHIASATADSWVHSIQEWPLAIYSRLDLVRREWLTSVVVPTLLKFELTENSRKRTYQNGETSGTWRGCDPKWKLTMGIAARCYNRQPVQLLKSYIPGKYLLIFLSFYLQNLQLAPRNRGADVGTLPSDSI